ncbi:MAG TPA: peptide chain release factor-like protein [Elusimicrobia bacterium]|nr:peptide chain release factor-like protein [Elusimicrobiota bacterium]
MKLTEDPGVRPEKLAALRERIARLRIDLAKVEETFTRGGGKGGQKINKTANRVVLRYQPLRLVVACQRERKRALNRFLALRELVDEIELRISPETSERLKEAARLRKRKARHAERASAKYGDPSI